MSLGGDRCSMNPSMDGSLHSSYSNIDYAALPEGPSNIGQGGTNCVEHVTMQGTVVHLPMPTSPECGYFPNTYEVEKMRRQEKRRRTIAISMTLLILSTLLAVFVLFEVSGIIDTDSSPRLMSNETDN